MKIRKALRNDAERIANVQVRSWQSSYRGIVSDAYLDQMSVSVRVEKWKTWLESGDSHKVFVLEDDERNVVGFISGGPSRSTHPYDAEIYAFYIIKEMQQKGYGTKMLKMISEDFVNEGKYSMMVWALKDNPSKQIYLSLGAKKVDEEWIEIGEQRLIEECFAWSRLSFCI